MGALHEGHASLLRNIRHRCEISILSIFVNPTQFGPLEDLSQYPRTFEADLKIARESGVDIVFAPSPEEIYPPGSSTFVEETLLSQPLCGKFRPGHFKGVTTVVLKLFNIVRPALALFGLKDAQQFYVLKKMVRDLHIDLKIEGIPTLRESDGLAMSSRNVYLSPDERAKAPALYQTLTSTAAQLVDSPVNRRCPVTPHENRTLSELLEAAQDSLQKNGFQVQYMKLLTLPHLAPPVEPTLLPLAGPFLIAVAAYLGSTRLIDNVIVGDSQHT